MTPEEAGVVLGFCAEADPSIKVWDGDEMTRRRAVLSRLCEEVPVEFALEFARRYYRREESNRRGIRGADFLTAWRSAQAVAVAKDHTPDVVPLPGLPGGVWAKRPPWFDSYRAQVEAVRREGGDPASVPLPYQKLRVDDSRERRCVNDSTCACTHLECRKGWLDEEGTITGIDGKPHVTAKRCPICVEAVEMKSELMPKRRGRR